MPEFPPVLQAKKYNKLDWTKTSGIVQGTYYTVLDVEVGHELYWLRWKQTNDESANKGAAVRVTLDDVPYPTAEATFNHNTFYFGYIDVVSGVLRHGTTEIDFGIGTTRAGGDLHIRPVEKHHLKIEMKVIVAPGTNQAFAVRAIYSSMEVVP